MPEKLRQSASSLATRVILPDSRMSLTAGLRALWRQRELLASWTWREIKVRYKQSILGVAWAILQPLSLMLVFSLVFTRFLKVSTGDMPYPVFAYTALLPWTFFAASLSFGATSVLNNMSLISKVSFPREILPLAQVAAAGFDFMVASVVLFGLLLFYGYTPGWSWLAVLILLAIQVILSSGLALLLSALVVRVRDMRFVVPLALQLWLYATPVIYPVSVIPESWRWLLRLNPMAPLIEGYRLALLEGRWPAAADLAPAVGLALLVWLVGFYVFKRTEVWFADIL